jgi:hypothetical protein
MALLIQVLMEMGFGDEGQSRMRLGDVLSQGMLGRVGVPEAQP